MILVSLTSEQRKNLIEGLRTAIACALVEADKHQKLQLRSKAELWEDLIEFLT